jgi:hypothetical protein
MHAAPRRYLFVAARRLPAAVVCHRYLTVVPGPLPAAPFLSRRAAVALLEGYAPQDTHGVGVVGPVQEGAFAFEAIALWKGGRNF